MNTIKTINLKSSDNNTYVLIKEGQSIIIDPSSNDGRIQQAIADTALQAILLTHGHYDHFLGLSALHKKYSDVPIYCASGDWQLATGETMIFNQQQYLDITYCSSDEFSDVTDGLLTLGNFTLQVFAMPGHSLGSVVYQWDNALFTGDVLFKDSIGRCDLVGGSDKSMMHSLKLFKQFNGDCIVYPGHGSSTTIERERSLNPWLIHAIGK